MKKIVLGLIVCALALSFTASTAPAAKLLLISGAGATFPYPLYSKVKGSFLQDKEGAFFYFT